MNIRLAKLTDLDSLMNNYHIMSDCAGQFEHGAGWVKDVYPTRDMIEESIREQTYYLLEDDQGKIAGGMSLNENYTSGYEKVKWLVDAKIGEFLSIHALGVMPSYRGKGYARELIRFAISTGKKLGYRAIRIDVLDRNKAAILLYPSEGFQYIETIELYYEDTGLTDYLMYEYIL